MQPARMIGKNLFNFRGKTIKKVFHENKTHSFRVYNKMKRGEPKDFCFEVQSLKQMIHIIELFEEEIPSILRPDMVEDTEETIVVGE